MTPEQLIELRKALSKEKEIYETYLLYVNGRIEEIDKQLLGGKSNIIPTD